MFRRLSTPRVAGLLFIGFTMASLLIHLFFEVSDYREDYAEAALTLLEDGALPTYVPPLFPALIAGVYAVFGVGVDWPVVLISSSLYFWGMWFLFRTLGDCFPHRAGRAAAVVMFLLVLLLPPYLAAAGALTTEGPFLGLTAVAAAFLIRGEQQNSHRDTAVGTAFLGLANYLRTVWFLFPVFFLAWTLAIRRARGWRRAVIMVVVMAATQVPFVTMHIGTAGNDNLLQNRLGVEMLRGNFPALVREAGTIDRFWRDQPGYMARWSPEELERFVRMSLAPDSEKLGAFFEDLRAHPGEYLLIVPKKLGILLSSVPGQLLAEEAGFSLAWLFFRALHVGLLGLFFWSLWRFRRRAEISLAGLLFLFTVLQLMTAVAIPRYLMAAAPFAYWVGALGFMGTDQTDRGGTPA